MCVIVIVQKDESRPSAEIIEKVFSKNPNGAGVAWRSHGTVHWLKGIDDPKKLIKLVHKLPVPYVLHCRIPTSGGTSPKMCHPFPIDPQASIALSGTTSGWVLFHNGSLGAWKDKMFSVAMAYRASLPTGRWSDSRAMAWMAADGHLGLGALELFDEKLVAFGPGAEDLEIFKPANGASWTLLNDVLYSNTNWQSEMVSLVDRRRWAGYGYDKDDQEHGFSSAPVIDAPSSGQAGGAAPLPTFSGCAPVVCGPETVEEAVEAVAEEGSLAPAEGEGALPAPVQHSTDQAEEGIRGMMRKLNPRRFHTFTPPPVVPQMELQKRLTARRNGCQILGRM